MTGRARKAVRGGPNRPTAPVRRKKKQTIAGPVTISHVGDKKVQTGLPKTAYKSYINSDAWLERRKLWFSRNERRCADCKRTDGVMHLHHLTYVRLGCELDKDLVCLCPTDHRKRHRAAKKK